LIRLVIKNKHGVEIFEVQYNDGNGPEVFNSWSESNARAFVSRKWPHIDQSRLELEDERLSYADEKRKRRKNKRKTNRRR
jgi:hypothetical protein